MEMENPYRKQKDRGKNNALFVFSVTKCSSRRARKELAAKPFLWIPANSDEVDYVLTTI